MQKTAKLRAIKMQTKFVIKTSFLDINITLKFLGPHEKYGFDAKYLLLQLHADKFLARA